jgi:CheY-like chemotaxis protein
LCRRLAKLLGGVISLRSTLGKGSTFTVTLPLQHQDGGAESASLPAILASSMGEARPGTPLPKTALVEAQEKLPRTRVLIIDDEPAARYTIRKLFDPKRYEVMEAADAGEGLRSATTMCPEIIVLDLNLPDRSGEDLLKDLRHRELTRKIPVIIATSQPLSNMAWTSLRQRASAVLPKSTLTSESFDEILASLKRTELARS